VLLLRSSAKRRLMLAVTGALAVVVLAVANPQVHSRAGRTVSLGQIASNLGSIAGGTHGDAALAGTRNFRLEWWKTIWSYTVHGPYFWTGKGFGINLADADGFQPTADHSLRAPHNTHMTVLARMGVPGLGLWVALQLAFAGSLLSAFWRARRRGAIFWARIDIWLLAYWAAMMVNTSFDPYLEGPQGSIWFWAVFGLGLAALRLQRLHPRFPDEETA
jgi:O-antigen ligase